VAAEGTFHFCFLFCFCAFLLGSLTVLGIGRFLMLGYQKSSAANTQHPQSASCFASLAHFTRTLGASTKRKRAREKFQTKTAWVVGAAGNDFWYPSMKSPPHRQPVPYPARTLNERKMRKQKTPLQRTGF
jgi:uncharacterized SAM-binding protein YcdF (DUF218 family)